MNEPDDLALLREYAANDSETAFEALVSRRVDFVYSAALRQTQNPHLAEEITQAVFILLAQKAGKISDKTILTGWLFKTTRFTALAQIRAEVKRSLQTASIEKELPMRTESQSAATDELWNQMSPLLDEALAALGETDRQAVLLRFFENKTLAEVGEFLGMGEDTARKRISRALEKLHRYLSKRGVSSTTAIIAGAISANSVHAAPMGLAKTISAVAITKGATASTSTLTLIKGALKIMAWTKAKTAIVAGAVVLLAAGTTATFVVQHKSHGVSPQIHIKARFIEIPKGSDDFLNSFSGILDASSVQTLLRTIGAKRGVETLGEPEVVTLGGRQTQMRATQTRTIVTKFIYQETNSAGSLSPQTEKVETGPVLDVVPMILDNNQIQIATTASITEFLGYADNSGLTPDYATNSAGQKIPLLIILPAFRSNYAAAKTTLADDQTLLLVFPKAEQVLFPELNAERKASITRHIADAEKKNGEKTVIVLVTATIVDSAGNRIHSITK